MTKINTFIIVILIVRMAIPANAQTDPQQKAVRQALQYQITISSRTAAHIQDIYLTFQDSFVEKSQADFAGCHPEKVTDGRFQSLDGHSLDYTPCHEWICEPETREGARFEMFLCRRMFSGSPAGDSFFTGLSGQRAVTPRWSGC